MPGVFIISPDGVIKQGIASIPSSDGKHPSGIYFDSKSPFSIGDENAYITFDGNGKIAIGGDGINIYSPLEIGGTKTLSEVLNDLGKAIVAIEYGIGDSPVSHSDIIE